MSDCSGYCRFTIAACVKLLATSRKCSVVSVLCWSEDWKLEISILISTYRYPAVSAFVSFSIQFDAWVGPSDSAVLWLK